MRLSSFSATIMIARTTSPIPSDQPVQGVEVDEDHVQPMDRGPLAATRPLRPAAGAPR